MKTDIKTVVIPARTEHEGFAATTVKLRWVCPVCQGPRGEIFKGLSYDGSLRLHVDCWINPCAHIDKYRSVRKEAQENGLNEC